MDLAGATAIVTGAAVRMGAAAPEPLRLGALTDAVVALIRDEGSAGRVVVLGGGG